MAQYNYTLICDSTCDLPQDWYTRNTVLCIPHGMVIDGQEHWDDFGASMPAQEVYNRIRGGEMPSTLQGRLEDFARIFEQCCAAGQDIVYVGFSSGLSGTYGTARMVAAELEEKYPGRKIVCFDSRGATMGHGIQVLYAQQLREQSLSAAEAGKLLESRCLNACHFFTVDDLNHLYRGGRLSKTSAVVGSLIGIKPVLHVDNNGKLVAIGKKRGRMQSLEELARLTAQYIENPQEQTVYITHGDCLGDAETLAQLIREKTSCPAVEITMLSPIIGVHSGPGTLAVFFWGSSRL